MDKEKIIPWVERLKAAPDGKARQQIVSELCKENGLSIADAWKLIKAAGFDPKNKPGNPEGAGSETKAGEEAEAKTEAKTKGAEAEAKTPAQIRHKTQYPQYRCAGLVLTQKPETYDVTESQLEKLRCDPLVVIDKEAEKK